MTEWIIQSRAHECEACGEPFADTHRRDVAQMARDRFFQDGDDAEALAQRECGQDAALGDAEHGLARGFARGMEVGNPRAPEVVACVSSFGRGSLLSGCGGIAYAEGCTMCAAKSASASSFSSVITV